MARILVIEDSHLSRRAIAKILQRQGHEVVEAHNGQQGLEMVSQGQPDCILLDLLMPEVDGWEVLQTLRRWQTPIPVIVITADIQRTSVQTCLDLGATAVIHKLPDAEQLCSAIAAALATRKAPL